MTISTPAHPEFAATRLGLFRVRCPVRIRRIVAATAVPLGCREAATHHQLTR
jgi:hypothetical protein